MTTRDDELSELEQLWILAKSGLDIPQNRLKEVLALVFERAKVQAVTAFAEELKNKRYIDMDKETNAVRESDIDDTLRSYLGESK